MDKAFFGYARFDYARFGVYIDYWTPLLKRLESAGGVCSEVTRRKLVLGERDNTTGWFTKNWVETTVKGVLVPKSSSQIALAAGSYVRTDGLFFTVDPFEEADELEDAFQDFWQVEATRDFYHLDSAVCFECDLTHLPLHSLSYSNLSPPVSDARKNTKTYWETYIDSSKLNNHSYIVCYADPDYPLIRVFKDKAVAIIFAVDEPTSTPLIGSNPSPYGYEEHVPTHILTLDTQLLQLGRAELRRIVETYPEGSKRTLLRGASHDRWLGSTRVYDREFILKYRRLTT